MQPIHEEDIMRLIDMMPTADPDVALVITSNGDTMTVREWWNGQENTDA